MGLIIIPPGTDLVEMEVEMDKVEEQEVLEALDLEMDIMEMIRMMSC